MAKKKAASEQMVLVTAKCGHSQKTLPEYVEETTHMQCMACAERQSWRYRLAERHLLAAASAVCGDCGLEFVVEVRTLPVETVIRSGRAVLTKHCPMFHGFEDEAKEIERRSRSW